MASKVKENKKTKAEQAPQPETPEQEKNPNQAKEPEQGKKPELPQEKHLLLNVLTILLVVVGIGELAALGLCGFHLYRGMLVKQQYEAQLAEAVSGTAQSASTVSYGGPGLKIENGVVVWQREDELPAGGVSGVGATVDTAVGGGQSRDIVYANLSVPVIHYRLAEDARQERLLAGQPTES